MSIDRAGGQSAAHGILRYATAPGSSSFTDFLAAAAPDLLPRPVPAPCSEVPTSNRPERFSATGPLDALTRVIVIGKTALTDFVPLSKLMAEQIGVS